MEKELCPLCCPGSGKLKGHAGRHRRSVDKVKSSRTASNKSSRRGGRSSRINGHGRARAREGKGANSSALGTITSGAWIDSPSDFFMQATSSNGNETFQDLISSIMIPPDSRLAETMIGDLGGNVEDVDATRFFGQPPTSSNHIAPGISDTLGDTRSVMLTAARRAQQDLSLSPAIRDGFVFILGSYADGSKTLFQTFGALKKIMTGKAASALKSKLTAKAKREAKLKAKAKMALKKQKKASAAANAKRRSAAGASGANGGGRRNRQKSAKDDDDDDDEDRNPYGKTYTTSALTRKPRSILTNPPSPLRKRQRERSAASTRPKKRRASSESSRKSSSSPRSSSKYSNMSFEECKLKLKQLLKDAKTAKHKHRKNVICLRCKIDQSIRHVQKKLAQFKSSSPTNGHRGSSRQASRRISSSDSVSSLDAAEEGGLVDFLSSSLNDAPIGGKRIADIGALSHMMKGAGLGAAGEKRTAQLSPAGSGKAATIGLPSLVHPGLIDTSMGGKMIDASMGVNAIDAAIGSKMVDAAMGGKMIVEPNNHDSPFVKVNAGKHLNGANGGYHALLSPAISNDDGTTSNNTPTTASGNGPASRQSEYRQGAETTNGRARGGNISPVPVTIISSPKCKEIRVIQPPAKKPNFDGFTLPGSSAFDAMPQGGKSMSAYADAAEKSTEAAPGSGVMSVEESRLLYEIGFAMGAK